MNKDTEERRPMKCCPLHPAAANREARRAADRQCVCRVECGTHPAKFQPMRARA